MTHLAIGHATPVRHWIELLDARMLGGERAPPQVAPRDARVPMTAAADAAPRARYRHFLAIPTRWMDNDSYGHVNNVTYYSYFDTAVNEHLIRAGGLDIAQRRRRRLVVETPCRFHKPLSFPETIDAGLRVARLGHVVGDLRDRHLPPGRRRSRRRRAASSTSGSTARRSARRRPAADSRRAAPLVVARA